ncbi:hypothetical protein ES708_08998 [subsurface metagenome]
MHLLTSKPTIRDEILTVCPECGLDEIISDMARGDLICSGCGLILDSGSIDNRAEWRAFSLEEYDKKSRVGSPTTLTLHDKGLSTIIDWRDIDAFGKKLSPSKRAQAFRLRKWHIRMRVHSSVDRNLAYAMNELDRLCSQLGIHKSIKETSALIYRKTIEKKLIRGRSIEAMIAASIYASCRIKKMPRTLDEFAQNSRINKRDLGRCFRLIQQELHIRIPTPSVNRFICRFGSDLNITARTQHLAIEIIKKARKIGLTAGKDPCGLAAASIYVASMKNGERKKSYRE